MSKYEIYEGEELKQKVADLDRWFLENGKLARDLEFLDFRASMAFLMRMAFEAEELAHHPEVHHVYNRVRLQLSTHDAGGKITSLDIELAKRINAL